MTTLSSQLNDQLTVVLRIDLHILVAVRIYHHPGFAEGVVERVVGMAMHPEIRAMVDDLVGEIGHEGAIEAVSPEPLVDRQGRNTMVCHHDSLPVAGGCQRFEDIPLRFLKQIDRLFGHKPRPFSLFDHDKVIHVLPGVLHLEEILAEKIRPEGSADEQDAIDIDGLVFQEMDICWQGELGLQLVDASEEVIVIEEMVPFDIDDGQKTLGQETGHLEPGLLAVSKADVAGNQGNGILVSR